MAKRLTDTEIWDKEWFMALSPKLKCLVKYVRDKSDIAGFWSPNFKLAGTYIGEKVLESDLLKIDSGNQFQKMPDGKIFCIGFISFQYGNKLNPSSPIHKKVIGILEKNNIDPNTLSNTLPNTLYSRVSDTLQEEEEDKEEEKVEVKEEEVVNPFGKNFSAWEGWKDYKRTEHREGYKSPKTEQAALTHLYELARGNPQVALEIIQQSIANRWKGLFELKNKNGNSKTQSTAFSREGVSEEFKRSVEKHRQAGGESMSKAV